VNFSRIAPLFQIKMSKGEQHKVSFRKKIRGFFTRKNFLIVLLILALALQYWQSGRNSNNISKLNSRESSMIAEIGQLKEVYTRIGFDLNEVRQFLRLPVNDYQPIEVQVPEEEGKNEDKVQLALFQYVDSIANSKSIKEKLILNKSLLDNLIISKDFSRFLITQDLAFAPTVSTEENVIIKINDKAGNTFVVYKLDNNTGNLSFQAVDKIEDVKAGTFAEFKQGLITFLTGNKADLLAKIQGIKKIQQTILDAVNSVKIQAVLKNKGLSVSTVVAQKDLTTTYLILNKANTLVGEIVFSAENSEISLVDKNDESMKLIVTDLMVSLPPFLNDLDARTLIEQKADEAVNSFQKTLQDGGFKSLLSKNGLYFSDPSDDADRIYYKLYDKKDTLISTFTLEKATGVVTVTDNEGRKNENLLLFDAGGLKKKP
jgi:hypothetical protein